MNTTHELHDAGQSLWLDNITRGLLDSGTLQRHVEELSVTGLTSNPTTIRARMEAGESGEALFFALAIDDLTRAADRGSGGGKAPRGEGKAHGAGW